MCVECFSQAMNQQFNYALFRKFSHHIAPGKVLPLLFYVFPKMREHWKDSYPTSFSRVVLHSVCLLRKGNSLVGFSVAFL